MKTKFRRIGKSSLSVLLTVMMLVSTIIVATVPTVNAATTYYFWYTDGKEPDNYENTPVALVDDGNGNYVGELTYDSTNWSKFIINDSNSNKSKQIWTSNPTVINQSSKCSTNSGNGGWPGYDVYFGEMNSFTASGLTFTITFDGEQTVTISDGGLSSVTTPTISATPTDIADGLTSTITVTNHGDYTSPTYTLYKDGTQVTTFNGSTYTVSETGEYTVTATVDGEESAESNKVTITDSSLRYKLRNLTTSSSTDFKLQSENTGGTKVYTVSIPLTGGKTYQFYVDDTVSGNSDYYDDGTLTAGGSAVTMYHYNSGSDYVSFTPSTTSTYKFTWVCNPDKTCGTSGCNYSSKTGAHLGTLSVVLDAEPLAKSVDLVASSANIMENESLSLTATINDLKSGVSNLTYTWYDGSTKLAETTNNVYAINNASKGSKNYYVVVSTIDSYTNSSGTIVTYGSVTSNSVPVTVSSLGLYHSSDISNKNYDNVSWTNITDTELATITTTVAKGGAYTFALSDIGGFNDKFNIDYTINSADNVYCTIKKGSILTGVTTYVVKCNTGCTNPKIYIDTENRQIYAVASFIPTLTNTENSSKKVRYYFAEMSKNTDWCKLGDGVRIKYWNNSTGNSGYYNATTKVDVNGGTTGSNAIYVNTDKLFNGPNVGTHKFYVYRADLPVWATSFAFCDGDSDNTISTSSNSGTYFGYGSNALNPNRIYLFYADGNTRYTKGVILDKQLWNSSRENGSSVSNQTKTKSFKSNIVNFQGDSSASSRNALNIALQKEYGSEYKHPLYFGDFNWFDKDYKSLTNFKWQNNLAQRKELNSYYASVWGLVGSKLYYPNNARSISTYGTLMGYDGKTIMPLFDYDGALTKTSIAYENKVFTNIDFPFYESEFNGIKTYSYDSTTDYNRSIEDGKVKVGGYETGVDGDGNHTTGYFPFGGNNDKQSNGGYGTEFRVEFYMTDSGKLTTADGTSTQDICFNFSGDDDVWVYVDGVLVLDLGGTHKVSAGSINFSDMNVYYKAAAEGTDTIGDTAISDYATQSAHVNVVSLTELLGANGVNFVNTDPSTKHTLQMFYLERGLFESNCSLSFNLPQNSGLLIESKVNTTKVNDALVDDTLVTANNDYFSYTLKNKVATTTELSNLQTKYYSGLTGSTTLSSSSLSLATPLYPLNNEFYREFSSVKFPLALQNSSTKLTSNDYIGSNNGSSFINVANVNYKLRDAYSSAPDDTAAALGATGRTNSNGVFNLLFGQGAQFDGKLTKNTLVSLTQSDTLSSVVTADNSVISAGTSTRKVSDYYTTTYSIYDGRSGTIIVASSDKAKNTSGVLATDESGNGNSFFYANYSDETEEGLDMTAAFTNTVDVGAIKIEKTLAAGITPNNDSFFFDVKFSNVFGGNSTSKTYEDLVYSVYTSTGTLVTTKAYGNGISIKAGEYALIEGIPVGTKYTVSERTRVGYNVADVDSEVQIIGNGTVDSAVTISPNFDVTGSVPTVGTLYNDNTKNYLSLSTLLFTNEKQAITVTFKFYDREVKNGRPAHISTTPTEYNKTYSELPSAYSTMTNGEITYINLKGLILNSASSFISEGGNINSVIDDYNMWTSQADAKGAIKNQTYVKKNRNYTDAEAEFHTNAYGEPQNDGEKWVTYYDHSGNEIDAETYGDSSTNYNNLGSITVWLFNKPKKYTINMYTVTDINDLKTPDSTTGECMALENPDNLHNVTGYYNVRLGGKHTDAMNDPGEHLAAYGVTEGYIYNSVRTVDELDYNGKKLVFRHWADKDGNIITTDKSYYYRITNNLDLYAVYTYEDQEDGYQYSKTPGVSVYANESDIYFDSKGVSKTRLNIQMGTYNCPDSDENIKQVALVYVMIGDTLDSSTLTDKDLQNMRSGITSLLSNATSNTFTNKDTVSVITVNKTVNGFVFDVVESSDDIKDANDVTITTKNRAQFSTTFTTSVLKDRRMFAFAAMNYEGENPDTSDSYGWIVSDNYVDFNFRTTV